MVNKFCTGHEMRPQPQDFTVSNTAMEQHAEAGSLCQQHASKRSHACSCRPYLVPSDLICTGGSLPLPAGGNSAGAAEGDRGAGIGCRAAADHHSGRDSNAACVAMFPTVRLIAAAIGELPVHELNLGCR